MSIKLLHSYLGHLDSHISEIKNLTFIGQNLWKVYRNIFVSRSQHFWSVPKNIRKLEIPTLYQIYAYIRECRNQEQLTLLRVTSVAYDEFIEKEFRSLRIKSISESFLRSGCALSILGSVEKHKYGKLKPNIDFSLDGLVDHIKFALKIPVIIIASSTALRHYRVLRQIGDIKYIEVITGLSNFISGLICYYLFYILIRPKCVLFTSSHYGQESEIAALKLLSIPIMEYQHASIYPEHYGYNYSQCLKVLREKLLLPDIIFVYSQYWKESLLSGGFYENENVIVNGHPCLMGSTKILGEWRNKILVTSQPGSAEILQDFLRSYMVSSPFATGYKFYLKLHPRESLAGWREFLSEFKVQLTLTQESLYKILPCVQAQIVCSSTSIYEASYFGVTNYILRNKLELSESSYFDDDLGIHIDIGYQGALDRKPVIRRDNFFDQFSWHLPMKIFRRKTEKLTVEILPRGNYHEWNELLSHSEQRSVFTEISWLSAYSEELYDLVVVRSDGKIVSGIVAGGRGGLLRQKISGPLIRTPPSSCKAPKRYEYEKRVLEPIARYLKKNYTEFETTWHPSLANWLPFYWNGFRQTTRYHYILDISRPSDLIFEGFEVKTRGDIRKALRYGVAVNQCDFDTFSCLYKTDTVKGNPDILSLYERLSYFLKAQDQIRFYSAYHGSRLLSCVIILVDGNCAYYLDSVRSDSNILGAQSLLLWTVIRDLPAGVVSFNFLGSMIPEVEKFFRGFGGELVALNSVYLPRSRIIRFMESLS